MAREGGKRGDAGTKVDKPSERAGKGTPAKEAAETKQSRSARSRERAAEKAATRKQGKEPPAGGDAGTPQAEDTAARETGVDKQAADVLAPEGAEVQEEVAAAEDAQAETESKPAQRRRRGSRGRGGKTRAAATEEAAEEAQAEEEPAEEEPATAPAAESEEAPAQPAARPARRERRTDGAAPVVRAQARYVRTSARKARLVCDHIRGKSVDEARAVLAYTPRAAARDWSKLLESAVANAENNHELVGDDLRVLAAYADEGPTLKRFRPRAMGRATRINKRTSHLTIKLTPKEN